MSFFKSTAAPNVAREELKNQFGCIKKYLRENCTDHHLSEGLQVYLSLSEDPEWRPKTESEITMYIHNVTQQVEKDYVQEWWARTLDRFVEKIKNAEIKEAFAKIKF